MIDFDKLIGKRNGIINNLIQTYIDENEPDIYSFAASRGLLEWEIDNKDQDLNIAGGGGLTSEQALISCCGEIVERYSSSFINDDLLIGTYNDLKTKYKVLNPEIFNYFSDRQYQIENFPFRKINQNSKLSWVKVLENSCEQVLIPAFVVYLPYNNYELGGKYGFALSTGLACRESLDKSYIKGIFEIIERDAFSCFWLNQLSPPSLKLPNEEKYNKLKKIFKFDNIEYIILDITSDFELPTVAIFSFSNSSFGYVTSLGLATDVSYYKAIEKALIENAQGRISVAFNRKTMPNKKYREDFLDVVSFQDHSYVYSTEEKLRERIKFIEDGEEIDIEEKNNNYELNNLIEMVNRRGYNVYHKDLTTNDIKDSVGLFVSRTVIPGLTHLHGIHPYPFLRSKRLYKTDEVFEWCVIKKSENELKIFPPHMLG